MQTDHKKVFLFNKPSGGGPRTFFNLLNKSLEDYHIELILPPQAPERVIFVISATRHLLKLLWLKFNGYIVIQRLDGFNWSYRNKEKIFSLKNIFYKFIQNRLMQFIRKYISDVVVYQSFYLQEVWNKKYGIAGKSIVIQNSARDEFFKIGKQYLRYNGNKKFKILCVEGEIQNDPRTKSYLKALDFLFENIGDISSVEIFGSTNLIDTSIFRNLKFHGLKTSAEILEFYKQPNLIFVVLELIPPCPNSVIEALASGIPVVGFNEGSFSELTMDAGIEIEVNTRAKSYKPIPKHTFVEPIKKTILNYSEYSSEALSHAKENLNSKKMSLSYKEIFNSL